jgi:hypothetical protein
LGIGFKMLRSISLYVLTGSRVICSDMFFGFLNFVF